ncbi:hypothetical protein DERP_000339 [Dermatophagoides pteronyssinus]|uniref:Uncharacterized protein n=1 Tax=Dermatophagoides pteronyssinus TaxID=6956 RepID=A0ABQ8J0F9_DERPT|nr:hypothetical protein DERP_000339 [Dermatophagoides pteronyssinus]
MKLLFIEDMGDVITEFIEDCSDCFLFISKQMSIVIIKDVKQKKMNDQELWSCQKSMYINFVEILYIQTKPGNIVTKNSYTTLMFYVLKKGISVFFCFDLFSQEIYFIAKIMIHLLGNEC